MTTNVLVLAQALNGVTWWRCFRPFELLRREHRELNFIFKDRNLTTNDLRFADLVIAYRPSDPTLLRFLQIAKNMGVPIVIDCDDDLINIPLTHPLYHDYHGNVHTFIEACALADYVWTSTEDLLFVMDRLSSGEVIPNAITPEDLPAAPSPWKGLFSWRGSSHHIGDLLEHAEWYEQSRAKAKVWIFKGYFPPLRHYQNAVSEAWEKDTDLYFARLKACGINVIWKPLQKTQFNASKSNIAWIEATMAGGVCTTNFWERKEWANALSFFPDEDEVQEAWERSRDSIVDNYNLREVNKRRFETIKALTQ